MTGTRARSCTGKLRYKSRGRAEMASSSRQDRGAAEWTVQVYRCRYCNRWHIGHRLPSPRQKKAANR
ncbi:MAG: hypothetical protein M3083_18045 [Actinomycetota bacterium]|nr:hypothetical protein [Actinomycetota bacterium]MDQ6947210.1 hypothetical protein [Actinomycetota bacterium]